MEDHILKICLIVGSDNNADLDIRSLKEVATVDGDFAPKLPT
jgi:hypothetical protein